MRNASFLLTEQQVLEEVKDVTRRLRWFWAKPGMRLQAVRKSMGRKAGEPIVKLKVIEITSVRREPLNALLTPVLVHDQCPDCGRPTNISQANEMPMLHCTGKCGWWLPMNQRPDIYTTSEAKQECRREGFPSLTPFQFVQMFCEHMKCKPDSEVTRAEFKYVHEI